MKYTILHTTYCIIYKTDKSRTTIDNAALQQWCLVVQWFDAFSGVTTGPKWYDLANIALRSVRTVRISLSLSLSIYISEGLAQADS